MAATNAGPVWNLKFSAWDYTVLVIVLTLTAFIGLYHMWRAKRATTTHQFLVADTRIGLIPLMLSQAATNLTPVSILGAPTEAYSNGVQFSLMCVAMIVGKLFAAYTIVPVLYNLKVTTFNEYVEYRFNRLLRIVPAIVGLLQNSIFIAALTHITAVILTKATGLHVWWSMIMVGAICIFYSSLGGVSAVIFTDVLQICVVFVTLAIIVVKGLAITGGLAAMWEANAQGQRTTWAYFKTDPHSNYTIWSIFIGHIFLAVGFTCTNQSELQRQIANRTLSGARKMSMFGMITMAAVTWTCLLIGMIMYARYGQCDPLLNGELTSRDMLAAKFAGEIFASSPGMIGLFVAAILCATLSTLSSVINAFATVTLMDFIKPLMPNITDATSTLTSKVIGILYGLLVISLSGVSQYLGGLVQTLQAIMGTSMGMNMGIISLGLFFPWATANGATVGYVAGLCVGWWLALGRIKAGAPYTTAPMSTSGCNSSLLHPETNFNWTQALGIVTEMTSSETAISEDKETFFLYLIIPVWYCLITVTTVTVVGLITSFATGSEDVEKLNPKLISPLTKYVASILPEALQIKSGLAALLANEQKLDTLKTIKDGGGIDLVTLNTD